MNNRKKNKNEKDEIGINWNIKIKKCNSIKKISKKECCTQLKQKKK